MSLRAFRIFCSAVATVASIIAFGFAASAGSGFWMLVDGCLILLNMYNLINNMEL